MNTHVASKITPPSFLTISRQTDQSTLVDHRTGPADRPTDRPAGRAVSHGRVASLPHRSRGAQWTPTSRASPSGATWKAASGGHRPADRTQSGRGRAENEPEWATVWHEHRGRVTESREKRCGLWVDRKFYGGPQSPSSLQRVLRGPQSFTELRVSQRSRGPRNSVYIALPWSRTPVTPLLTAIVAAAGRYMSGIVLCYETKGTEPRPWRDEQLPAPNRIAERAQNTSDTYFQQPKEMSTYSGLWATPTDRYQDSMGLFLHLVTRTCSAVTRWRNERKKWHGCSNNDNS